MTRSYLALLALASLVVGPACQQRAEAAPLPEWVLRTEVEAQSARRVFDGNVELSVSILNKSQSPLVVEHLDADKRVLLKAADGTVARLHPASVGVAKPIRLHPNERATTSLLFTPLKSPPSLLVVYDDESEVKAR